MFGRLCGLRLSVRENVRFSDILVEAADQGHILHGLQLEGGVSRSVFSVLSGRVGRSILLSLIVTLATLIPNSETLMSLSLISDLTDPSTRTGSVLLNITATLIIAGSAPTL